MIETAALEERIRAGIPDATHVQVVDLRGGDHFQATVVAPSFAGMTRVAQHQSVYRALGELMGGPVHALAIATHTPESWARVLK
jgi:stress-induced morphogen